MIFTGGRVDAKTAEQLGLVNKVVPLDQLKSAVKELASEIMNKPPIAIELSKQLINKSTEIDLRVGLMNEAEAFGVLASTEDFREGVGAFLEKRKPHYKGK